MRPYLLQHRQRRSRPTPSSLHQVDTNLLVVLDVLLEEKSATAASKRLGISRSAVSHALRRLRDLLGDPILIPAKEGLKLSPVAIQLRAPLRRILDELETLLNLRKVKFDPVTQRASFTIAAGEWFAQYALPGLTDELQTQAPGVRLHLVPLDPAVFAQRMASGELDLAIGALDAREPELESVVFARDHMVGVVRDRHPFARTPPTAKQYAAATHAIAAGSAQLMREVLAEMQSWNARVAFTVAYQSVVPHLLANRDIVVTMARVLALRLKESNYPVAILEPPVATPRRVLKMVWHRDTGKASAHRWLRQRMISLLAILSAKWSLEWEHP